MEKEKFLNLITKNVVIANEDTSVKEISRLMKENDIGTVVVLRGEEVVGIVSERDIARRVVAESLPGDTTKASDIMTRKIVSVELREGLNVMYKTLCEMKFRHLVVMNEGKLLGITSIRDFVDTLTGAKKVGV